MNLSKTLKEWASSGHPTAPQLKEASKEAQRLERFRDFFLDREGIPLFGMKEARQKAKVTQVQLAEKTGLPQPMISNLERQKALASNETAKQIAKAIGVSLEDLL